MYTSPSGVFTISLYEIINTADSPYKSKGIPENRVPLSRIKYALILFEIL